MVDNKKDQEKASNKDSDRQVLDDILLSKEKREAVVFQVKRLAKDIYLQEQRQKALNEDIKASAENFGLSVSLFKSMIKDSDHKDLKELIAKKTSYVDILTIIDEGLNKEKEPEEYFDE